MDSKEVSFDKSGLRYIFLWGNETHSAFIAVGVDGSRLAACVEGKVSLLPVTRRLLQIIEHSIMPRVDHYAELANADRVLNESIERKTALGCMDAYVNGKSTAFVLRGRPTHSATRAHAAVIRKLKVVIRDYA